MLKWYRQRLARTLVNKAVRRRTGVLKVKVELHNIPGGKDTVSWQLAELSWALSEVQIAFADAIYPAWREDGE